MKQLLSLFLLVQCSFALATILPPNNLNLEDSLYTDSGLSQKDFNEVISNIESKYVDIFSKHGAMLIVQKRWTDSTVNAYAQQDGNLWKVTMFGGLARRREVTKDGFGLVMCHEIFHHKSGHRFYEDSDWAASEGASDFQATHACAKYIWKDELEENAKSVVFVDSIAKKKCDEVYSEEKEKNLCYRTANAGQSISNLLAALGGSNLPSYSTPDQRKVTKTYDAHPNAQCRLDTYLAGALCTKKFDDSIIPGKFHPDGRNSFGAQQEAFMYSCLYPACWFAELKE